jgi:hypothetical protein
MGIVGDLVTLLSPDGTGVNGSTGSALIGSGTGVVIRSLGVAMVEQLVSTLTCALKNSKGCSSLPVKEKRYSNKFDPETIP